MKTIRLSLPLYLLALAALPAAHGSMMSITSAGVNVETGSTRNCSQYVTGGAGSSVTCSGVPLTPVRGGVGSGSAWASAGFSALHAHAEVFAEAGPEWNAERVGAGAGADFVDYLTIGRVDPITGESVAFIGHIRVTGSISGGADAYVEPPTPNGSYASAEGHLQISLFSDTQPQTVCAVSMNTYSGEPSGGTKTCSTSISFGPDESVGLFLVLGARADMVIPATHGSAVAAFGHTGKITGIEVFDANDNPVPDAVITTLSGYQYGTNTAVPEPQSLALIGAGLLFLGARRRAIVRGGPRAA